MSKTVKLEGCTVTIVMDAKHRMRDGQITIAQEGKLIYQSGFDEPVTAYVVSNLNALHRSRKGA